ALDRIVATRIEENHDGRLASEEVLEDDRLAHVVFENDRLDRLRTAAGFRRPGHHAAEFVRRRTTCMCGALSEPIDATDRMQGPVDIDPQLSADLRAERLKFMQNAARERPKPRQCRKQFTDRAR